MCRVTVGHFRVTVGHPRVTIGHLRLTIGYLRVTVGIGGFAKRAHPARARYLNVNLARRNRDLQPGGKEIEGGGGGGGGGEK